MMDLLKRFEEENENDSFQDDTEDDDDIARRLQGLDLESSSSDAIWSKLTPAERDKFLKALNNPSSELAQQLLASEELEKQRQEPWWEASILDGEHNPTRQFGAKPEVMYIPSEMMGTPPKGPNVLIYNLCAICIAYAHTTRYLSLSPLSSLTSDNLDCEARRILCQLVPFVMDRKARTLHTSLSGVVTDIWSRFDVGVMRTDYFSILLRDAACLLRPASVTVLPPECTGAASLNVNSHPHGKAILALSDISKLFKDASEGQHIRMKLLFYAAHVLCTPSAVLCAVADETVARSMTIGHEAVDGDGDSYEKSG